MALINMRRYDTSTYELPSSSYAQPPGRILQQHAGSLSRCHPVTPHPPIIPSDPQTFPILPGQLEKHLEQAQQRLVHSIPPHISPASGSVPSSSPGQILVLNSPPVLMPAVYAFHASTLGMPSVAEYLRFFVRYLDGMSPNKRGKALIDSELLRRIELILVLQYTGLSSFDETGSESESAPSTPGSTGGNWDTPAFRRWVRNTFVYRQATRAELERAVDFGLLSPPESSLSGPGVPGHPPSTGLTRSRNLVFHQDRPVALRSRIYKIILRAHWITNHAGRDRTWAMVREVCSYIPKCLVYDFVAACPTCRVARSGHYGNSAGVTRRASATHVEKMPKFEEKLQHGFKKQVDGDSSSTERRLPPILLAPPHDTPPEGWIPHISPNSTSYPYPPQMPTYPPWHLHRRHEVNTQIAGGDPSNLPFGPNRLPPFPIPSPPSISIPGQAAGGSHQPNPSAQSYREPQRGPQVFERRHTSWVGIPKLIDTRVAQDVDVDVLVDFPALGRKDDLSVSEGGVESGGAYVGHETMVNISESDSSAAY